MRELNILFLSTIQTPVRKNCSLLFGQDSMINPKIAKSDP